MKHWNEQILQMKFGKLAARLAILSICVVLLGGILCVVLLRPQMAQIASAVQQAGQNDGLRAERFPGWELWDDLQGIAEPAPPVKAALSAIGAVLWPLLGLFWNVWGLLLFLVVRSLLRRRCPSCGVWQQKASFCRTCGAKFHGTCPACGAECGRGDGYCSRCGTPLKPVNDFETPQEVR